MLIHAHGLIQWFEKSFGLPTDSHMASFAQCSVLENLEDSVIKDLYRRFWGKATDAAIGPGSACFGNSVEDIEDEERKSWQTRYLCEHR